MGALRDKSGNAVPNLRAFDLRSFKRWYVVANRTEAVIFRGQLTHGFDFVHRMTNPNGKLLESELHSDKPGRSYSSAGKGVIHHSLDQRYHQHEKLASDFAFEIADFINSATRDSHLTELILVAEPHFLGLLRRGLAPSTKLLVKYEIKREYNEGSDQELYEKIQQFIEQMETETK